MEEKSVEYAKSDWVTNWETLYSAMRTQPIHTDKGLRLGRNLSEANPHPAPDSNVLNLLQISKTDLSRFVDNWAPVHLERTNGDFATSEEPRDESELKKCKLLDADGDLIKRNRYVSNIHISYLNPRAGEGPIQYLRALPEGGCDVSFGRRVWRGRCLALACAAVSFIYRVWRGRCLALSLAVVAFIHGVWCGRCLALARAVVSFIRRVWCGRRLASARAVVSFIHRVWCWLRFVFGVGFLRPSCAVVSFVRRVWFWSFALVLAVLRVRWFRFARRLVLVDTGQKLENSRYKLAVFK